MSVGCVRIGEGIATGGCFIVGDLCKKALPSTAETQTQVFVYFRP